MPGSIPGANLRAAKPGDILVVYALGVGITTPAQTVGTPAAGAATVAQPVAVTIGGVALDPSDILYAGPVLHRPLPDQPASPRLRSARPRLPAEATCRSSSRILEEMKVSVLALLAAALPALADSHFQIRHKAPVDIPVGKGACDIRLRVDQDAEVTVRGDQVDIRSRSGQGARDDGSVCSAPMPTSEIRGFAFDVKDARGEIQLLAEPSSRNGFATVVQILDKAEGFGRYHFRLTWALSADPRTQGAGGFIRNNAETHQGKGSGEATLNQEAATPLGPVTIEIDLTGKILVAFRVNGGQPLLFTGTVVSHEQNRWKADTISAERSLHGPMEFTLDGRGNVNNVTLAATDGRDRLQLTWNRR